LKIYLDRLQQKKQIQTIKVNKWSLRARHPANSHWAVIPVSNDTEITGSNRLSAFVNFYQNNITSGTGGALGHIAFSTIFQKVQILEKI
jgi:hypothetical protein